MSSLYTYALSTRQTTDYPSRRSSAPALIEIQIPEAKYSFGIRSITAICAPCISHSHILTNISDGRNYMASHTPHSPEIEAQQLNSASWEEAIF